MNELIEKINQVLVKLGGLDARFDSVEKKVDSIEDEIKCIRLDASKNLERIIRLEESNKNVTREIERINIKIDADIKRAEERNSNEIKSAQESINTDVDKKLLVMKLAFYSSLAAAGYSLIQFALGIWGAFK